jgi:ERCC4-type nuclease
LAPSNVRVSISPTEHQLLNHYRVSSLCEQHGCDIMLLVNPRSRTDRKRIGVQRKQVSDLLASMADGRLNYEVRQMGNLTAKVLIVEGVMRYTNDGVLVESLGWGKPWTKAAITSLLFSARAKGLWVVHTDSIEHTIEMIEMLAAWWGKDKHTSLDTRPGPVSFFGTSVSDKEWGTYMLQSLPGVGPELAKRIYELYGVPWSWDIGVEELMMVEGVGEKRAIAMLKALER